MAKFEDIKIGDKVQISINIDPEKYKISIKGLGPIGWSKEKSSTVGLIGRVVDKHSDYKDVEVVIDPGRNFIYLPEDLTIITSEEEKILSAVEQIKQIMSEVLEND